MGREIRMVPPHWDHPKGIRPNGREGYQPMFNELFEDAATVWKQGFAKWQSGERPSYYSLEEGEPEPEFWEYHGGPPGREYYRPWKDDEATWYQVWETVSEGTPVSPPFATKEELIEYLVANGDFWDQKRRADSRSHVMSCDPWPRHVAESFVNGPGWAPSMVADASGLRSGVEALSEKQRTGEVT
ncbi:MAG: hypothetical protein AAGJ40_09195 [Planctomycetota bacterium]